jgi:RNA polymerase sigma factor (sigma-70 family)
MSEGDLRDVSLDLGPGISAADRGRLFSHHRSWLRTVISSRLVGREDIEDVLQEVAAAAAGSPAPPEAGRWPSWLYRIAVRQILLFRRRVGRRRRREVAYARLVWAKGRAEDVGSAYDPLRLLLAAERIDLIRKAVGRLPRRDAEVILLKYTEGWSYRDIAERLGMTESAVEDRLHRARMRLRAELEPLKVIEGQS